MTEPLKANQKLQIAIQNETKKFHEYYSWMEQAMPKAFFEDVPYENVMLITHSLMGFHLQEYFSIIHAKRTALVLCLDSPDADLRILKNYAMYGIKNYETYVSSIPLPGLSKNLRIATLFFTEAIESVSKAYPIESKEKLRKLAKANNPDLTDKEFETLFSGISNRFLRAVSLDRLVLALEVFFRAKDHDNCQYEVRYNQNWEETKTPSMQIVLAWRNTPKHNFLYRLARTIHRHDLMMKHVHATYIEAYSSHSILVMALDLHGSNGQAAWSVADLPDFLRELVTVKYFASFDTIDDHLVSKGFVSGNFGNLLRAMINFIHQALVNIDVNLYTIENIELDLCRHPELTVQLCEAFKYRFDPDHHNANKYFSCRESFLNKVYKLDTGQIDIDSRRKNVLLQGMSFVHHTLKTNFYRSNFTALSFRLDPKFLDEIPFERVKKFPELPYAIFFVKGMHFFAFHIRFKDLARGGLRTVFPEQHELAMIEQNAVFAECYGLAYTQHMKNKDIPEGGAKGVIFLRPYDRLESESMILEKELKASKITPDEIEIKMNLFRKEQKLEFLYQAQRAFIENLLMLVNCENDGTLRAKYIVDYWKRPEYLYLGPDENMHDTMIQWIANFSKKQHYKPGSSFISSKPRLGINHKQYGVTSLGLNVYLEALLKYMGIDPTKDVFTLKMSGGPDGDVAGNQICNLYQYYPETAKLLALTDATGTIYDPKGLDLHFLTLLFKETKGIRYYPPQKLSEDGFLVDRNSIRKPDPFVQQTLCWRKVQGKLEETWLSGSDSNYLLRNNVHKVKTDVFIPSGGRPKTLNESNIRNFLDETGKPTSLAIVEGANLYLTNNARHFLENLGVFIIKDSSANKTGVICSSFEVLCGLALGDEKFLENKEVLVQEILGRLKQCAAYEADLILRMHKETHEPMTHISDKISSHINQFTSQILDHLDLLSFPDNSENPLVKCFLDYCLPTLQDKYQAELIKEIPEHHKKAIIACHIGAHIVYKKGLKWFPSIVDILPLLLKSDEIVS